VDGREPYPWAAVLPLAGLRLQTDTIYDARLGINTDMSPEGLARVTQVIPGGAAAAAGLQAGDLLLKLGTVQVRDNGPAFDEFRRTYASAATGTPLPIVVRRNGQELTLNGQIRKVARTETKVVPEASASPKAVRVREGIIKGTLN